MLIRLFTFQIISLASPDWIIETNGNRLGLMWECLSLYNRKPICFTPTLSIEWLITLILIFVGCILLFTVVILLIASRWDRNVIFYARWIGFTAMVSGKFSFIFSIAKCFLPQIIFCLAAVIFPLGFYVDEIGNWWTQFIIVLYSRGILDRFHSISSHSLHRWARLSTARISSSRNRVHILCAGTLDNCRVRAFRWKNLPPAFLMILLHLTKLSM